MSGFIKGEDRNQATLFPERLDDYIAEIMGPDTLNALSLPLGLFD